MREGASPSSKCLLFFDAVGGSESTFFLFVAALSLVSGLWVNLACNFAWLVENIVGTGARLGHGAVPLASSRSAKSRAGLGFIEYVV